MCYEINDNVCFHNVAKLAKKMINAIINEQF